MPLWQRRRVGECYKEDRNVLEEEMRTTEGCGMEKLGTLDSSEKTTAVRWLPQTAIEEGDKTSIFFVNVIYGKKRTERPNFGGVSVRSR